jgi:hypothetical protein
MKKGRTSEAAILSQIAGELIILKKNLPVKMIQRESGS